MGRGLTTLTFLEVGALLLTLFLIPMVEAAPTILPTSSSAYAVQATDYFEFAGAGLTQVGTTWTLTAPDGTQATVTKTGLQEQTLPQRWSLDGTLISGDQNEWTWQGGLIGVPGDGTWLMSMRGAYVSQDFPVISGGIGPTLSVGSRGIHFGTTYVNPSTTQQLWNYRSTTGIWNEPSTVPQPTVGATDLTNEGPEEDPNNAVFFQDAGSEYSAYTLHATVTCGASAALHTMTVNGAWIGATGSTNSLWASRDGNLVGTTDDLRTVAGTTITAPEAEGSTGSGTDTESVSYNNAAGSSYQFFVSTSAQGEAKGIIAYAAAEQCTPVVPPTGLSYSNAVYLSVSHAQCANDPVSFTIDLDLTVAIGLNDIDLAIYSATTGALLANYDDATMFNTQTGQVYWMADVFLPGPYMAQAVADVGGVGAVDLFDS